jgi:hypothetical protein
MYQIFGETEMKLNEGAFFAILFICFTILALGSFSLEYWNTNQVRMTYQTAYQKNMECRISTNKYGPSSLDKCGKIPQFEDYQK